MAFIKKISSPVSQPGSLSSFLIRSESFKKSESLYNDYNKNMYNNKILENSNDLFSKIIADNKMKENMNKNDNNEDFRDTNHLKNQCKIEPSNLQTKIKNEKNKLSNESKILTPKIIYENTNRGSPTSKSIITHASVKKLIEKLTDMDQHDTIFRDIFLLTYRSYCTPFEFVRRMIKRYVTAMSVASPEILVEISFDCENNPEDIDLEERISRITMARTDNNINNINQANVVIIRVISVLKYWIKESGYIEQDLLDDLSALKKIFEFLKEIRDTCTVPSIQKHADNMIKSLLEKVIQKDHPFAQMKMKTFGSSPQLITRKKNNMNQEHEDKISNNSIHSLRNNDIDRLRKSDQEKLLKTISSKLHINILSFDSQSLSDIKEPEKKVKIKNHKNQADVNKLIQTKDQDLFLLAPPKVVRGVTTGSVNNKSLRKSIWGSFRRNSISKSDVTASNGPITEYFKDKTKKIEKNEFNASFASLADFHNNASTLQPQKITRSMTPGHLTNTKSLLYQSGLSIQEMANQLTLIESEKYFKQIKPREFMEKAWTTCDKHKKSPNVMAMVELFETRVNWVSSEILHHRLQTLERAKTISYFIDIADACRKLNNFNTLFEITTGLLAPCIKQLTTTWALVQSTHLDKFQYLQQICSIDDNYKNYRQAFVLCNGQPRLPCLFVIVKDIFNYEESMKSKEYGLVHFRKFKKIYMLISEALDCQNHQYTVSDRSIYTNRVFDLKHNKYIQNFLTYRLESIQKTSSELFKLAKKANTHESILFVNSLSEAGFL